jgi:hypothetical protein
MFECLLMFLYLDKEKKKDQLVLFSSFNLQEAKEKTQELCC